VQSSVDLFQSELATSEGRVTLRDAFRLWSSNSCGSSANRKKSSQTSPADLPYKHNDNLDQPYSAQMARVDFSEKNHKAAANANLWFKSQTTTNSKDLR
jgi:hypothetical protein